MKAVDFLTTNDKHRLQKEAEDILQKAKEETALLKQNYLLQERNRQWYYWTKKAAVASMTNKVNAALIGVHP